MIDQSYAFECDICGTKKEELPISMSVGETPRWPVLPSGWRYFAHMLVCERHDVTIVCETEDERIKYSWPPQGEITRL